jgi:hypothetical protein
MHILVRCVWDNGWYDDKGEQSGFWGFQSLSIGTFQTLPVWLSAGNFTHGTDEGVGDKRTSGSWTLRFWGDESYTSTNLTRTCKIRRLKNVVCTSHCCVPIRNGQLMVVQVKCCIIGPSGKGCWLSACEDASYPYPRTSLTHIHRFIGFRNPNKLRGWLLRRDWWIWWHLVAQFDYDSDFFPWFQGSVTPWQIYNTMARLPPPDQLKNMKAVDVPNLAGTCLCIVAT